MGVFKVERATKRDEMSPRKNWALYTPRANYTGRSRGAVLTLPSNNDERWKTFFLNDTDKTDKYFEEMVQRMALENLKTAEIGAKTVPQLDINAIRYQFQTIRSRIQLEYYDALLHGQGTLEDDLDFSRDVCGLKTLMQGLQIPPANGGIPNPRTHGVVPDVTISAMRSEIGRTLGHLQEITAFVKGERIRFRQRGEEGYNRIKAEWDGFKDAEEEWLWGFQRRASRNPERLRSSTQDEFVLGTFDLIESYTGNGLDLNNNTYLNRTNKQYLRGLCQRIRRLIPNLPVRILNLPAGPSRRRKRRRVDYYY